MIGTLVKITGNKKLMVKISEAAYDSTTARLISECKKKNFRTPRLATFSMENDDGDDNYFVMLSLDKYDKQNMRKFEQLLRKDIAFQYKFKPYDFIPDSNEDERCQGINLELISIHPVKPREDAVDKMVAARISQSKELTAEEQAIDEDVEEKVAQRFPLAPPVLERTRRRRITALEEQMEGAEE